MYKTTNPKIPLIWAHTCLTNICQSRRMLPQWTISQLRSAKQLCSSGCSSWCSRQLQPQFCPLLHACAGAQTQRHHERRHWGWKVAVKSCCPDLLAYRLRRQETTSTGQRWHKGGCLSWYYQGWISFVNLSLSCVQSVRFKHVQVKWLTSRTWERLWFRLHEQLYFVLFVCLTKLTLTHTLIFFNCIPFPIL